MANRIYQKQVTDLRTGQPLPGAKVTVYLYSTTTRATIYTDSGAARANPMTANADALVAFQADESDLYQIVWALDEYVSPLIDLPPIDESVAENAAAASASATAAAASAGVAVLAAEGATEFADAVGALVKVGGIKDDYAHVKTDHLGKPMHGHLARDLSFHTPYGLSDELVEQVIDNIDGATLTARINKGVVIFGDSRTAQCTDEESFKSNGYLHWLRLLMGQRFEFKHDQSLGAYTGEPSDPTIDNYGHTGDQTSNLVARIGDLLAKTTSSTIILWVGTNDIGEVATAISKGGLTSLLDDLVNDGRRVILIAETGKGDATFTGVAFTGDDLADWNDLHQFHLDQRARTNVYVGDPRPYWVEPLSAAGHNKAGLAYDGNHPAAKGAFYIAKTIQPIVEALFPPVQILPASNADQFDGTHNKSGCLNTNPMLDGTGGSSGGQISGNVATGYACSGGSLSSATIVCSKSTGPNGIPKQVFTFSGTVGAGTPNGTLLSQSILAKVTPGDVIEAVVGIDVSTAPAGVTQFALVISASDAGGIVASGIDGKRAGDTLLTAEWPAETFSGVMRTPKVKIPSDVTLTAATVSIVFTAAASTAISGVVGVYALGVRKVNL